MALQDWSGRRMLRLWLFGAVAEALIIFGAWFVTSSASEGSESAVSLWHGAAPSPVDWSEVQSEEFLQQLQDSLRVSVTAQGDSLTVFHLADSTTITVADGGVIRSINFTGETEADLTKAVDAVAEGIQVVVLLAVGIYLPIPAILSVLTLLWWFKRKRWRPSNSGSVAG